MSMKIVFILALAVSAYALPSSEDSFTEDVIPPETELAAEAAAIHQEAEDYMKSAGSNACKSLADATEQEVKDNVKAEQDILNKIDKGAKCPEEGEQAVQAMNTKLKNAEDAKKKADGEYDDALNADVKFGTHKFNSLTKGNCNVFYNSAAYTQAEQAVKKTKDAKNKAAGNVSQAKKDLEAAKNAQKIAIRTCRCNTYKNHESSLKAANKKVKDANNKAWTKAAHLKCVLNGKTTNNCNVPAIPQVSGTTLATGVNAATCSSWDNRPQCQYASMGGQSNDQISWIYRNSGGNSWNSGCYMKGEATEPGVKYTLEIQWRPYEASNSGNVHAMWGFNHLQKSETSTHVYSNMDYVFYCHAVNQAPYVYESGSAVSTSNGCNCGGWANTKIIIEKNGQVKYYMQSNYHGMKHCYTSNKKATNFPYVVDESIYGARCKLKNLKLTHS